MFNFKYKIVFKIYVIRIILLFYFDLMLVNTKLLASNSLAGIVTCIIRKILI